MNKINGKMTYKTRLATHGLLKSSMANEKVVVLTPARYKNKLVRRHFESAGFRVVKSKYAK